MTGDVVSWHSPDQRSPVEIWLGTSPSQAAKSRPLVNTPPAPIAATIARSFYCRSWSPTMQNALITLARALTGPVDLMVTAGEEDEWARARARWSTECQHAANED